jgi:hypothetical protein
VTARDRFPALAELVERGVVGRDVHRARWEALQRGDRVGHGGVADPGVGESHPEVGGALAAGHHVPGSEVLEGDIPQPRGVAPVGFAGVHG